MKGETMLYKEGDIIRRITEDGDGEIVRVLEDQCAYETDDEVQGLHVAVGNDDSDTWVDADDYELVTNNQPIQECKPMEPNVPERTNEDIHEDIAKMFVQCAQYMQSCLDGDNITLKIEGDTNGDKMDVSFTARVRYGEDVISGNLFRSAEVAVERFTQDKGLKPLQIAMNK
jgi:hypothetical protein